LDEHAAVLRAEQVTRERALADELAAAHKESVDRLLAVQRSFDQTVIETQVSEISRRRILALDALHRRIRSEWSTRHTRETTTEYEKRMIRERLSIDPDMVGGAFLYLLRLLFGVFF
jgi:hypothetical protein